MTTNRFDVCVDWAGETLQAGTLYVHDRSAAVGFEYASAWLARADAFAIDPTALPLRHGAFHALDLPGALADAGPDRWGRIVIERSVRQGVLERRPYRAIDYLLAIEDTARIGAIRLRPSGGTDFLGATRGVIPPLIRLRELLAATDAVHGDRASSRDLAFLLGAGSPLGGARPKCLVSMPDGALALAKFSKPDDVGDIATGEILALAVAREAGIHTADHRLVMVDGRGVAVIRRFDREGKRRIPFISAATLLGLLPGDSGSYTRLADGIRAHGHTVTADLAELWRRLAYSILIGNVDDHMRNHGLLMRAPGQWALSPAYDINPAPMIDRAHGRQTPVSEDSPIGLGAAAEIEEAVARADRFGLRLAAARAIVGEVQAAIRRWRSIAVRGGIADAALGAYADCFGAP
jgi:serine/threonine-protein kinase HipA